MINAMLGVIQTWFRPVLGLSNSLQWLYDETEQKIIEIEKFSDPSTIGPKISKNRFEDIVHLYHRDAAVRAGKSFSAITALRQRPNSLSWNVLQGDSA
jgi:hypothetical protein